MAPAYMFALEEGTAGEAPEDEMTEPPRRGGNSNRRKLVLWTVLGVSSVLVLALGLGLGLNQKEDSTASSALSAQFSNSNSTTFVMRPVGGKSTTTSSNSSSSSSSSSAKKTSKPVAAVTTTTTKAPAKSPIAPVAPPVADSEVDDEFWSDDATVFDDDTAATATTNAPVKSPMTAAVPAPVPASAPVPFNFPFPAPAPVPVPPPVSEEVDGSVDDFWSDDGTAVSDPEEESAASTGSAPATLAFASARLAAISPESVSQTYSTCPELAEDLKTSTRLTARRYIESYKWYFQPNPWNSPVQEGDVSTPVSSPVQVQTPVMSEPGMALEADRGGSAPAPPPGVQGESSFGTNNQVDGVEEPDIVQSNGVQVYAVYGSEILELDAASSTLVRRTKVPQTGDCSEPINAMLLMGQRLVVITSKYSYCYRPMPMDVVVEPVATTAPADLPIISTNDATRVLVYDTTNMAIVSDESLRGYYMNSRAIGNNVHIVTSTYFDTWRLLQFLDPYLLETEAGKKLNETEYQRLAETALESRLDNYVNKLSSELDCAGTQKITLLQNTEDDLSMASNIESMVSITSFDATNPASKSTKNMLIPNGGVQVYSSAERLVLAIQGWWMGDGATQQTYLVTYKYAGASTNGSTLGSVPGYVLNQFSMDHMNQDGVDYLRVATSTQSTWAMSPRGVWEPTTNSTSQVSILQFNDGQAGTMPMVGKITDLGKPGEQIFSVRFIGDKGFVVTFLQTDPFYTLDLSDPANPLVAGELEIPGFSSYLHPAGDDFIIGVGQAADADGRTTGLQISLFDVSDFSNPVRVQNLEVASRKNSTSSGASSEAQYDHKAFRYLETSRLLIIPVTYYEYKMVPCPPWEPFPMPMPIPVVEEVSADNSTSSEGDEPVDSTMPIDTISRPWPGGECMNNTGGFDGFRVYRIDEVAGISQYFSIEHAAGNDFAYGCWSSSFLQPRSLVFEGDLMTLKGHSILSNDLFTLLQDAAPVILDNEEEECKPWIYF